MRTRPILLISAGLVALGCQFQPNILGFSLCGNQKTQGVLSDAVPVGVLQMQIVFPESDSWDTATIQLCHSSFRSNPRPRTYTKGVNLVPVEDAYVATESFGQLSPKRGYVLTTDLWSGGPSGTLMAESQQTLDWIMGKNVATVSLAMNPSLVLSGVTPSMGIPGDSIILSGEGFSVLSQNEKVSIGGVSAGITPISSTSLKAVVPDLAPDYYPLSLQVGTTEVLGNFEVLGTEGPFRSWEGLGLQQRLPSVAPGVDRYCMVWMDRRLPFAVYGRMLDGNGLALGQPFRIFSGNLNPDAAPRVAFNAFQKQYFVVAEYASGEGDICGQFVGSSGALDVRIGIAKASYPEKNPFVCAGSSYLVLWEEIQDLEKRICGRYLERDGRFLSKSFPIATSSVACSNPSAAYSANSGKFFVTWASDADAGIMGCLLKPGATASIPILISSNVSAQCKPTVAWNSMTGDFFVIWLGGDNLIYGQRISSTGIPSGDVVSISNSYQSSGPPEIAYQPWRRKYIVTWIDQRSGNNEVYGQHISEDGTLWGASFPISSGNEPKEMCGVAVNVRGRRSLAIYQSASGIYGQKLH